LDVAVTLEAQKQAARAAAFARRKLAFEAQNGGASGLLSEILAGYRGAALAGFMPINTEIDPRPAMAEASAHGVVGVPVIKAAATPLEFALWSPETVMVAGTFKTLIPADVEWMIPEIVIVPLVAWDKTGGRLGYGGGFYDRTLESLRARGPVLAIGFAFNAQQAYGIPLELTDQPLDMIVTEDRVLSIGD
jgi:5-formyltetrahydrofolate cyclo-ligase